MPIRTWLFVALLWSCGEATTCRGDSGAPPPDFAAVARPTYRFTARITRSDVPPFKVGEVIEGRFSYGLVAETTRKRENQTQKFVEYDSPHNRISFRAGKARFVGAGDCRVTAISHSTSETFVIFARLTLPEGWSARPLSCFCHIILDRTLPKRTPWSVTLPERLRLSRRDLHILDVTFARGVRFPSGEVKQDARVRATLETLEETAP
jgi:hypothetical protein